MKVCCVEKTHNVSKIKHKKGNEFTMGLLACLLYYMEKIWFFFHKIHRILQKLKPIENKLKNICKLLTLKFPDGACLWLIYFHCQRLWITIYKINKWSLNFTFEDCRRRRRGAASYVNTSVCWFNSHSGRMEYFIFLCSLLWQLN